MNRTTGNDPDFEKATDDEQPDDEGSIFERVVPESVMKRIESGMESVLKERRLKNLLGEFKLPKELVNHMLSQVDETKHAALAVVAKEVRQFLEKTNLSEELSKVLTQVSLEVSTQVRFVPNEKALKKKRKPKKDVPPSDES